MEEKRAPLIQHLQELRRVLIISLLAILLGMIISYFFWQDILREAVFGPLLRLGEDLVMIGVTEGFFVQLKLLLLGGMLLACPVVLWQVVGFVLPAFYSHEKKAFWFSFLAALFLFAGGVAFGYTCVLDLGLRFLLYNFTEGMTPMISASKYLSFFTGMLLPFGLVFELPLAAFLLARMGLISPSLLREKRAYVVLAIFLLAAFLSPGGDLASQILLAVPMLLLYEASIWLLVIVGRKREISKSKEK